MYLPIESQHFFPIYPCLFLLPSVSIEKEHEHLIFVPSLLCGMMFSLLYNALTQYSLINDKSNSNILSGRLALLVSFAATVFIASYSTMTMLCTNKPDCNEIHPYVVWVPVSGCVCCCSSGWCAWRFKTSTATVAFISPHYFLNPTSYYLHTIKFSIPVHLIWSPLLDSPCIVLVTSRPFGLDQSVCACVCVFCSFLPAQFISSHP